MSSAAETIGHYLEVARENHTGSPPGPARDWEAGRIAAYSHALEVLAETSNR